MNLAHTVLTDHTLTGDQQPVGHDGTKCLNISQIFSLMDIQYHRARLRPGQTETEETASRPPVKVSDLQLGQGGQTGAGRTSLKYKLLGLKMSQNIFSFIKNVTTKHIHKIFPSKYRLVFSDTRH